MPGTAVPALECGIPGVQGGRSEGRGSAPGTRARALPALRSQSSAPAAGKGAREGATDSGAWRSSPFFPADPGKGGRLGGGTAKGGFPPSCEQRTGPSPGWELRPSGGATEREHEHWAESGEWTSERGTGESEGRTEPPQRTDAPGGALAPEGVSGSQIEQLGNPRAERGRAGRPGQSCGGRVNGPRPHPSRVCHRPGWQRGGWVLEVSLLK